MTGLQHNIALFPSPFPHKLKQELLTFMRILLPEEEAPRRAVMPPRTTYPRVSRRTQPFVLWLTVRSLKPSRTSSPRTPCFSAEA